jgi:hypothetical protein
MSLSFKSIAPVWGDNYCPGYIGFIHHLQPGFVSQGIAYFQGHPAYGDITVTHALVVSGEDECIEAQSSGVKRATLTQYFNDKTCAIVFRKPRNWHPSMGQIIVDEAAQHVGDRYAYTLILAQALSHSKLGRLLNRWWHDKPDAWVSRLLDYGCIEFCSELCAKALKAVPELRNQGILQCEPRMIDVQELFGSKAVFEDWK